MPSSWIEVSITQTQGSTPRGVGAVMWVSDQAVKGSIGGGRLEFDAITHARAILSGVACEGQQKYTLGPDMGQCCGGQVALNFLRKDYKQPHTPTIAVFGAGHIGAQIAHLAQSLPLTLGLYDTRARIEIANLAPYEHVAIPEAVIDALPARSRVVIATHDHGLDFLIAERALSRGDLAAVMMIGSNTKAAQFRNRFPVLADGLICPIAKTNDDKRPEMIALAILSAIMAETR